MADSVDSRDGAGANHLLWLGPLIAVPGLLSYFAFFSRWPIFRDAAWLNFLILAAALAISAMGLRRAWARVFIVQDGTVRWRALTKNWRVRIRPEPLLDALKQVSDG